MTYESEKYKPLSLSTQILMCFVVFAPYVGWLLWTHQLLLLVIQLLPMVWLSRLIITGKAWK